MNYFAGEPTFIRDQLLCRHSDMPKSMVQVLRAEPVDVKFPHGCAAGVFNNVFLFGRHKNVCCHTGDRWEA